MSHSGIKKSYLHLSQVSHIWIKARSDCIHCCVHSNQPHICDSVMQLWLHISCFSCNCLVNAKKKTPKEEWRACAKDSLASWLTIINQQMTGKKSLVVFLWVEYTVSTTNTCFFSFFFSESPIVVDFPISAPPRQPPALAKQLMKWRMVDR